MLVRRALLAAALSAPLARAQASTLEDDPYPYPYIGDAAPDFLAPLYGGGGVRLSEYRGKTVVLAFGGVWCPSCVLEEQDLNQLARLIETDPDMAFLAVHSGERFGRWGPRTRDVDVASEAIARYRARSNTHYPLAFDLDAQIARAYRLDAFPTILIIAPNGVIRGSTSDLKLRTVARFWSDVRIVAASSR
ncbi:MAG: TlpA disulfide reductase family protein [Hyphomonadaceae bacterium]|nr:TlpA disulfide reductase family protein [Hyphomonadaceae bacterium]